MSRTPTSDASGDSALATTASPSQVVKSEAHFAGTNFEIDSSISDEERRFYLKMYPTIDLVNQRRVHCTVCRSHIGTAVAAESNIKMHPILRVTHCVKCHEFYNSGEFSKGEDGSELYCRWCGQGGEVYCCSTCPFVFCKSCIVKNLSRGVIVDIEQNENWNCFNCTSKILWPLRGQHWALVNYIQTQKKSIQFMKLPEAATRKLFMRDDSTCCRLAKSKTSSISGSVESLESNASKRSQSSSGKKPPKTPQPGPPAKRPKSNDEVVCTPDLMGMLALEPECQLSVKAPARPAADASGLSSSSASSSSNTATPRIVTVQQNYSGPVAKAKASNTTSSAQPFSSVPPPLVLSGSGIRYRQVMPANSQQQQQQQQQQQLVRRTVVPNAVRSGGPVFHTINGFRVDLNSAAQQDSYRLPNGRLIQVKRQMPGAGSPIPNAIQPAPTAAPVIIRQRPPTIRDQRPVPASGNGGGNVYGTNMGIYHPGAPPPRVSRSYNVGHRVQIQPVQMQGRPQQPHTPNGGGGGPGGVGPHPPGNVGPVLQGMPLPPGRGALVRHVFSAGPIGSARTQLQDQIFNCMEICTHLTSKVQTLTNSNAYNQARSYLDLKELYIHLSYLMTYAIGRFKGLQDKCLADMRELGFTNDANSLENGQLAADKQASDDEDNEIQIVEPKTDTITIDSDNEDESRSSRTSSTNTSPQKPTATPSSLKITSVTSAGTPVEYPEATEKVNDNHMSSFEMATFTSSILASMLEVDITESNIPIVQKPQKQPRKKTTSKRNPALLQLERERMEETKRTDARLNMKVVVKLRRAEEEFPIAKKWIEEQRQKQLQKEARERSNDKDNGNDNDEEEDKEKESSSSEDKQENDNDNDEASANENQEDVFTDKQEITANDKREVMENDKEELEKSGEFNEPDKEKPEEVEGNETEQEEEEAKEATLTEEPEEQEDKDEVEQSEAVTKVTENEKPDDIEMTTKVSEDDNQNTPENNDKSPEEPMETSDENGAEAAVEIEPETTLDFLTEADNEKSIENIQNEVMEMDLLKDNAQGVDEELDLPDQLTQVNELVRECQSEGAQKDHLLSTTAHGEAIDELIEPTPILMETDLAQLFG